MHKDSGGRVSVPTTLLGLRGISHTSRPIPILVLMEFSRALSLFGTVRFPERDEGLTNTPLGTQTLKYSGFPA